MYFDYKNEWKPLHELSVLCVYLQLLWPLLFSSLLPRKEYSELFYCKLHLPVSPCIKKLLEEHQIWMDVSLKLSYYNVILGLDFQEISVRLSQKSV